MHKRILIAGAGQLGSRYLQGLARVSIPLEIHVTDISENSLRTAEARWDEVASTGRNSHRLFFTTELKTIPKVIDLAIVATGANERATLVQNILHTCEVEYWILEKVLAQNNDQIDAITASMNQARAAWVNTPRRVMEWYQKIKSHFVSNIPIELTVTGGQWGLACNAIHFLDLIQWWTREQLLLVNTRQLDKEWIASKRPGYFEVVGTIEAQFHNGSTAFLSVDSSNTPLAITIRQEGSTWTIKEQAGEAIRSDGLIVPGCLELQSSITKKIVEKILIDGKCDLPSVTQSADLHKPFLLDMLAHWNQWGSREAETLPIT